MTRPWALLPVFLPICALGPLEGCGGADADLPAAYRRLSVPEERLASEAARERGRQLFLEHCALCHGVRADGKGVRRQGFSTPPADFTDPRWRGRVSPRRVYHAVREGVQGTAMPSWKALSDDEIWDLVAYVLSVGRAGS
jgi:high-affinity iron transporter